MKVELPLCPRMYSRPDVRLSTVCARSLNPGHGPPTETLHTSRNTKIKKCDTVGP